MNIITAFQEANMHQIALFFILWAIFTALFIAAFCLKELALDALRAILDQRDRLMAGLKNGNRDKKL